jgi:23S rRNA (adenine2030-N6)-methyltransferase
MNYRHAFHAGNHADVFKHAALTLALERLLEKPAPFAVLDTHAGIGVYDLASDEARRSPEHEAGAARIFERGLAAAPDYARLLVEANPKGLAAYPGSPELVRSFLREHDRLIACELHPEDAARLKTRYRRDPRVAVHHRDGYEAVGALTPPAERRGLVFIDPPFEAGNETERLLGALAGGLRRWSAGVFMAWYPLTDANIGDVLSAAAVSRRFPKAMRAEFAAYRADEATFRGGGLLFCNTPWRLGEKLSRLCEELAGVLGDGHASWSVEPLTAP